MQLPILASVTFSNQWEKELNLVTVWLENGNDRVRGTAKINCLLKSDNKIYGVLEIKLLPVSLDDLLRSTSGSNPLIRRGGEFTSLFSIAGTTDFLFVSSKLVLQHYRKICVFFS